MKTLILRIEYDGTNYSGWQRQKNAETVQGCLERGLERLVGEKYSIVAAGRTDAGVHARGQIVHAPLSRDFPVAKEKIVRALNSNLPRDIRATGAAVVDEKFHSRFDAMAREYSYTLLIRDSVFRNRFAAYFKYPMDPDKLNETASIFLGKHDFTTFSKFNADAKHYVCDVSVCGWEIVDEGCRRLTIKSDRFVYGMVRSLVGAMLDVARGKRSNEEIAAALDARDRNLSSQLAEPQGLILEKIYYPKNYLLL